eukprot:6485108-Amphidinium_carterae.2
MGASAHANKHARTQTSTHEARRMLAPPRVDARTCACTHARTTLAERSQICPPWEEPVFKNAQ